MKQSLQQYRRLGALGYAKWVCQANGIEFTDTVPVTNNHAVNAYVADILNNPVEIIEEEINPMAQEDAPTPFVVDEVQYDSLTVAELRELCKERGLPVSGTKANIVLRLNQNDAGVTDGPTEEVAPEETPDAPTEEVAVTNGSEIDEQETSSDKQEPIIE
tara:strand:+ start:418 stop:897 length:480 start_codon:yes stop_codon:yes gene_type:complete